MTGNNGAHSWKKTFRHLSENKRGGAKLGTGVIVDNEVDSFWGFKNVSVSNPTEDLPLSWILRLQISRKILAR